jgi:hypothetical protein
LSSGKKNPVKPRLIAVGSEPAAAYRLRHNDDYSSAASNIQLDHVAGGFGLCRVV